MIVYFAGNARNIKEDVETYRAIIRAVQEVGGIMTHNWVETALLKGITPREADWWCEMQAEIQTAILDADCIIVEVSATSTLGVGFELASALHAGKPTLALVKAGAENISYISGVNHPLLFTRSYSSKTLGLEVKKFLKSQI